MHQRLPSVLEPYIWDIGLSGQMLVFERFFKRDKSTYLIDIVASSAGEIPMLAYPVPLDFHLKATLYDRVSG